jgi:hypothetical protein
MRKKNQSKQAEPQGFAGDLSDLYFGELYFSDLIDSDAGKARSTHYQRQSKRAT